MSLYTTTRQFAGIAAAGFIVLIGALALIRGQRGERAGIMAPLEREEADVLASELARCHQSEICKTSNATLKPAW
jgi:hypothetical protein